MFLRSSRDLRAGRGKGRRVYGASHHLLPKADLITPSGSYTQSAVNLQPMHPQRQPSPVKLFGLSRSSSPQKRFDKRTTQSRNWIEHAVPAMVDPFLALLAESNNLRNVDRGAVACACSPIQPVSIMCVSMDGIAFHEVCGCALAVNLVRRGYFPSSPLRPSVALDIKMLSFMRELYVRSSPNVTAWSTALEVSLQNQGYKLSSSDMLRRKVGACIRWFNFLVATKDVLLDTLTEACSLAIRAEPFSSGDGSSEAVNPPPSSPVPLGDADDDSDDDWVDDHTDDDRPSCYLQDRCPLCFGGDQCLDPDLLCDVIVCLDANFTQKRRKPSKGSDREPPFYHPNSVFLTDDEVAAAESYVDEKRPTKQSKKGGPVKSDLGQDFKEPGMRVPVSALNGCLDSFTAADEQRTKASTRLFTDTGVMGLLCRHDRVLWLANMTSSGERQFYAIALLMKLFEHLPPSMTVGLLYDIGCQLERSCIKWDFLQDVRDRIIFGISVFHAYGHQWACQLIYHPCKCAGFGLSDGEGCERFWAAIKFLIAPLRVSGYHQRLFSLDVQIAHLSQQSLENLGSWLVRKWGGCMTKKKLVLEVLKSLPWDMEEYGRQWEAQKEYQTRPLARVSQNAGKKAIEEVLSLIAARDVFAKEVSSLDNYLLSGTAPPGMTLADVLPARDAASAKKSKMDASIEAKRAKLGVDEKAKLLRLLSNKFIRLRVNALSIKERILAKVQSRKFQMERLEKAVYTGNSNDQKLRVHIETQLKKQEPNISNLVKRYNTMVEEMEGLIQSKKAPSGAIAPHHIDRNIVFSLDVDDPIWDNSRFQDVEGFVQLWMGNDNMRRGIKAYLELQRCQEEEIRLMHEASNFQAWCCRAWKEVESALSTYMHNSSLHFQFNHRRTTLLRRIAGWSSQLSQLRFPGNIDLKNWGPTADEIEEGSRINNVFDLNLGGVDMQQEEDVDSDLESVASLEDLDLWEANEWVDFGAEETGDVEDEGIDSVYELPAPHSPTKRPRMLDD